MIGSDLRRVASAIASLVISSAVAAADPSVTLKPVVGPPTTTITVSGAGFGANAAVDIYFDTADVCLSLATAAGAILCTIKAPKDAQPQIHYISAVQRNTGTGAQKAFTVRTDWAQFHGLDGRHTGFNPYENTIDASNVRNLDVLWAAPIGTANGTSSTPVVVAGRVYIAANDSNLYSFSNKTGAPFAGWPKALGAPIEDGAPAVEHNIVFVGTIAPDNKLYAFNSVTGATIAGFPVALGGPLQSSPTLFAGNVYVACGDGKVYAFNETTGVAVAGFPITVGAGSTLFATVSAANGQLFEGSTDHNFYAFNAATGAAIAGFPVSTGSTIISTAALVSGQIFFGSDDDDLHGVRRHDGLTLSGFPVATSNVVRSSPAIGDGQVVVGSFDHKVYSFDPNSGAARWSATLDQAVSGSPIIANGVVYVNSAFSLYALSETDGSVLWRGSVLANTFSSPTVADGIVYLGSNDGNLYAFSVNGRFPASRLPGGEHGVRPDVSSLIPDYSLKPRRT